ncbi:coiled-coil domain-containing protein 80 isoform X3 [Oncorhynchus mykiss]|uniref:coiled-coil domain-containing protein 80 isoform X3 n=1 Tax=Oncorhynchus mykiss TaxID=8022 RepID=UPI00187781D0|nr:coiled-coil domain-containing protein 80 isoform X3 [Oncorhynchus mykiss]
MYVISAAETEKGGIGRLPQYFLSSGSYFFVARMEWFFFDTAKMKQTLHLCVLWLLLVWSTGASDRRPLKRTILRRTSLQGGIFNRTQNVLNSDSIAPSAGGINVSTMMSHRDRMQRDEKAEPPRRRMMPSRRIPQQPKKPINQVGSGTSQDNSKQVTGEAVQPQSTPARTVPGSAGSLNVLASFAGKNRVLVISAPHDSDGYYRLMMTLLKSDVYCQMAERHMQMIVMFHQEGERGGKVRRVNAKGQVTEEPLDTVLIPRLMNFLKLEEGKFGMVLLRKTLQVEERYPYPVRLEAMYEVMDQTHMRKLEKARQRGFVQRCKAAGVEGQVVESQGQGVLTTGSEVTVNSTVERVPVRKGVQRPAQGPKAVTVTTTRPTTKPTMTTKATTITTKPTTTTTTKPTRTKKKKTTTTTKPPPTTKATTTITTAKPTTTTTRKTTTTTTKPTTTTTTTKVTTTTKSTTTTTTIKPTPTTKPKTTTTRRTTTPTKPTVPKPLDPQTTLHWDLEVPTTDESFYILSETHKNGIDDVTESHRDQYEEDTTEDTKHGQQVVTSPTQLTNDKPTERGEELSSELKVDSDAQVETASPKKSKVKRPVNAERKKKADKSGKKSKADKKRLKATKDSDGGFYRGRRPGKKAAINQEKEADNKRPPTKQPNLLVSFFGHFEKRRRLLVISTPDEENPMYTQQRDEYLEHVCELGVRKISLITIFGSLTNGTMKMDHYQAEKDQPLKGMKEEDFTNQPLIRALRNELGLIFDDYYMVLTDFDMKVKQEYEVPIAMTAVFGYIDTFSSRIKEMEQQKRQGVACKKEDKSKSLENFLSRFRWRRRLFVISSSDDEEWAYQQQLYALTSQACNLGLRHLSVLKLIGKDMEDMGGTLELYPINGTATVEREDVSPSLVQDIRNYFQISPEYFSMLLVGKDGNVKSWYPSPMWSMSIIYDLVDSMQLRRQEMAIQQSLGMRCPEDEYGGYGHDRDPDGYHRGYGY